jgi:hypothetical protein
MNVREQKYVHYFSSGNLKEEEDLRDQTYMGILK